MIATCVMDEHSVGPAQGPSRRTPLLAPAAAQVRGRLRPRREIEAEPRRLVLSQSDAAVADLGRWSTAKMPGGVDHRHALTVADELAEMGLRVKRLEQELAALQDARVSAADRSKTAQAAVAAALAAAAERVENVTRKLNQTIGGSGALG